MNSYSIRTLGRDLLLLTVVALVAGVCGQLFATGWRRWNEPPQVQAFDRTTTIGLPDSRIIMFASSTCPACAAARKWMESERVHYVELTLDQSEESRHLGEQLQVRRVPTFLIDDVRVNGFLVQELKARLQPRGQ